MNRIAQIAARANNLRKPDNGQYCILGKVGQIPAVCSPLPPRFLRKIAFLPAGCWHWIGTLNRNAFYPEHSYGVFCPEPSKLPIRLEYAHRFAFVAYKGEIPEGLEIDHLCHNKLCVNPEHLELVTHKENCRRRRVNGPAPGYRLVNGKMVRQ